MNTGYARDLDLNLLRVFLVVARTGSVTAAASELYVTQPAVSAALRRLQDTVGAPLFARRGRGLVLTARGEQLCARAEPHLRALIEATLSAPGFDPTLPRTLRLGLGDDTSAWLLPDLLRRLADEAPGLRLIVLPVQFRTIGEALSAGRLDLAVTVADELPANVHREPLFRGRFVCLRDARHISLPPDEEAYFACAHVIVSYNGDLRGVVEDALGRTRRVRCSVPTFAHVARLIEGSDLLATLPERFAATVTLHHPWLRSSPLPFHLAGAAIELLQPAASLDDPAVAFVARQIRTLTDGADVPSA